MQENEEDFAIDISGMLIAGKVGKGAAKSKSQTAGQSADSSQANSANASANIGGAASAAGAGGSQTAGLTTEADVFKSAIEDVEALQQLTQGKNLQYSSTVRPINDSTAEYVVSTMKHFYDELVIVQYGIKNTLDDQVLSGMTLKVENFTTESGLTVKGIIPLAEGDSIRV